MLVPRLQKRDEIQEEWGLGKREEREKKREKMGREEEDNGKMGVKMEDGRSRGSEWL